MQPNNIFTADEACGPEHINDTSLQPNVNMQDDDNNMSSLSYDYMIYSDDDDNDEDSLNETNSISSKERQKRKLTKSSRKRSIDYSNADEMIKYITILLKDASQKERKIKRLQVEFDQKTKEVADLKEIYEKLKRKR